MCDYCELVDCRFYCPGAYCFFDDLDDYYGDYEEDIDDYFENRY